MGPAVMEWLNSWLAEQEVRGSNLGLGTLISEIEYLHSRNMTEILFKRRNILKTTPTKVEVSRLKLLSMWDIHTPFEIHHCLSLLLTLIS